MDDDNNNLVPSAIAPSRPMGMEDCTALGPFSSSNFPTHFDIVDEQGKSKGSITIEHMGNGSWRLSSLKFGPKAHQKITELQEDPFVQLKALADAIRNIISTINSYIEGTNHFLLTEYTFTPQTEYGIYKLPGKLLFHHFTHTHTNKVLGIYSYLHGNLAIFPISNPLAETCNQADFKLVFSGLFQDRGLPETNYGIPILDENGKTLDALHLEVPRPITNTSYSHDHKHIPSVIRFPLRSLQSNLKH